MTTPQVTEGTIVRREWALADGLRERSHTFHSLDELYALCLATETPQVIDRLIIQGVDALNQPRVVTFVFQSITVSHPTTSG
jgi:hypothetical protein